MRAFFSRFQPFRVLRHARPMLKVYTYAKCGTCRRAVKFLRTCGVPFREVSIRETPPTQEELRAMLEAHGGHIRKLFNTAGRDYQAFGLSAKLPAMNEHEALALLAGNGNLVKRPFAIGEGIRLTGFDEKAWSAALG